jgi:hypothetical protein
MDDGNSDQLRGDPAGGATALDWFFANLNAGQDTIADQNVPGSEQVN